MTSQKPLVSRLLPTAGLVATLILSGCGGTDVDPQGDLRAAATPQALATSRSFSCTQTTSSRGTYRQAVSGTLDGANVPHNVVVTRVKTGNVEISSATPTLVPHYDGDYWKRTYDLNTWYLGSVNTGFPADYYYFNMPAAPGSTFTAMLKTDFGTNASQGNWQHWMACTAQ
jgi:hypothetical protein